MRRFRLPVLLPMLALAVILGLVALLMLAGGLGVEGTAFAQTQGRDVPQEGPVEGNVPGGHLGTYGIHVVGHDGLFGEPVARGCESVHQGFPGRIVIFRTGIGNSQNRYVQR